MANALDRVKVAEAKYAAMAGTAEKLEATLKKLKGTAQTCQSMAVSVAVVGGIFGNFLREAAVRILDALGAWWRS